MPKRFSTQSQRAMCRQAALLLLLAGLSGAGALSGSASHDLMHPERAGNGTGYLPVVLWHGMGDSCCSPHSMGAIQALLEETLPGVFVHSISLGGSTTSDVLSSYFGNVNDQVARVCDELLEMEQLQGGYVAVGFSQGGQFMRALLQRCQHLGPPMHTLVTMGAQHQGVMSLPGCPEPGPEGRAPSLYCRMMQGLIARGAYQSWVQGHVVQAQYVKDPYHQDLYRQHSIFLADINGEVPGKVVPARYRQNLGSLQRLVLFQFDEDDMVVPRESSHFGFFNGTALLALRDTPLYKEDWIGLRALDEAGRLLLEHCPSRHMQFSLGWFKERVVLPYLAVPALGVWGAAPAGAAGGAGAAAGGAQQ